MGPSADGYRRTILSQASHYRGSASRDLGIDERASIAVSSAVHDDRVIFRFPNATFPLRGSALGQGWTLEVYFINGASCWRAYLKPDDAPQRGSDGYYIESASSLELMHELLTRRGVDVLRRSPVATVFRAMETQGLAERVPPAAG